MALKLVVLGFVGLVALSCFGNVNGLKCYECDHAQADLSASLEEKVFTEEACNYKMPKGLTTDCPTSAPYCIKSTGTVINGKYFETRRCTGQEFKKFLMGDNSSDKSCESAKNINSTFIETLKSLGLEIWEVCFCDTDKCNSSTYNENSLNTFIIVGLLSVLLGL